MNSFLIKLRTEGKLELVEKSQEIYESYLIKSENCLKSAKILLKESIYENSIINSYYAMYNCVLALLFKCGIKCQNHTGSIIHLKEIFSLPKLAKSLEEAKKSRIDSQYYVSGTKEEADQSSAEKAIITSENFILELRSFIANIKNSEIDKIRDKLQSEKNKNNILK